MNRLLDRRFGALALLAAALLATAGCADTMTDAATIRQQLDDEQHVVHIDRDDFTDELRQFADNEAFREALAQTQAPFEFGAGGTVGADLSATWLGLRVRDVVIEAELQARGIEVTEEDRSAAQQQVPDAYLGAEAFAGFDESFRDELVERAAREFALQRALTGDVAATEPTEADARAFFEENREAITACESGKEVAHILVETREQAEAALAELDAGASFADVAVAQSVDTGSGANGGSLGCLTDSFVEDFQTAADAAALDTVVGPVETEFGHHLILVTAWDPQYEDFRDAILAQLEQQAQQEAQQRAAEQFMGVLNARYESMKVRVDERYGTFGFEESTQAWIVTPPSVPEPREQRERRLDETADTLPELIGG